MARYRNLYVLGDSLSDNGAGIGICRNLSFASDVKFDEPFYQGRSFSDGPVAVEYLARCLGIEEFKPGWKFSVLGMEFEQRGQNYAVSYATASEYYDHPIYPSFLNKFRLANQLGTLIEHNPYIGQEDLFLIIIGGNDIMLASVYDDADVVEEMLDQAVSEICNALKVLSEHNVQHVIVANVPDVGLIPAINKNNEEKELATKLTQSFNAKLADSLESIKKECTNLKIEQFDLYSKVKNIVDEYRDNGLNYQDACISDIANGIYGFLETTKTLFQLIFQGKLESCYSNGCSEEDLNKYFFFDYFHPTAGAHQYVGNELCELMVTFPQL